MRTQTSYSSAGSSSTTRRIAPAFFVVTAATTVAAWWLLPPSDLSRYGGSLTATSTLLVVKVVPGARCVAVDGVTGGGQEQGASDVSH